MNILPVTYKAQTYNVKPNGFNTNQNLCVCFKGNSNEDTFTMKTLDNTLAIYRQIRKKNFKEAHAIMSRCNGNYDPNYVDAKTGKPLLITLAEAKPKKTSLKEDDIHKDYLMQDLICHKDFAINRFFPKNYKGKIFDTTYAEEAIETKNLRLMLCLKYYGNLEDTNGDCWQTLINRALEKTDKNMELLLRILGEKSEDNEVVGVIEEIKDADEIKEDKQNKTAKAAQTQEKKEEKDENKEIKELLESAKVTIPQSIPAKLDEIGGLAEAKKDIENFIIKPWQPEIHDRLKRNHISLPNGFLLYGPPGCGKTFVTQAISKQTGFPLYLISSGTIGSKWVNETSNNLHGIFKELEKRYQKDKKPSILFFDEIDSLGMSRDGNSSVYKREDLDTILMLINNAGERGIIVIGATNFPQGLDEALTRSGRLDKKIEIKLPTYEERKDILMKLFQRSEVCKGLLENIDFITQKTEDKTPADIAKYVNNAGLFAIYDGKKEITLQDFLRVMEEVDLGNKRPVIGFNAIKKMP